MLNRTKAISKLVASFPEMHLGLMEVFILMELVEHLLPLHMLEECSLLQHIFYKDYLLLEYPMFLLLLTMLKLITNLFKPNFLDWELMLMPVCKTEMVSLLPAMKFLLFTILLLMDIYLVKSIGILPLDALLLRDG